MKTLKFKPHLVDQIIAGTKTSTWRLFDDKDIQVGDVVSFFNYEDGDQFGSGTITDIKLKILGKLDESDWVGQEREESEESMYAKYRSYYGDTVSPDTEVKIITFTFNPKRYNKVTVVDENNNVIGAEFLPIARNANMLRRGARTFVVSASGQILIQRRSATINRPLLLDISSAGCVDAGESYENTAKRELEEELNLTGYEITELVPVYRANLFFHATYRIDVPDDVVVNFNQEEVAEIYWMTPGEIDVAIEKKPNTFTKSFLEAWTRFRNKFSS